MRMIFGLIPLMGLVFFWKAIYARGGDEIGGYTYGAMILYFVLSIIVETMVAPTDDEWQISADIRDGRLNFMLLKPVSYIGYRFMLFASARTVYTLMVIGPMLIVIHLLVPQVPWPNDPVLYLITAGVIILAAVLQFLIAYTLALISFWILEVSTLIFIFYSLEYFFSGHLFPVDIMPPWLYNIIKWTPFPYELFFPVVVFQGRITGWGIIEGVFLQLFWILVLYVLSRILWSQGLKNYSATGG